MRILFRNRNQRVVFFILFVRVVFRLAKLSLKAFRLEVACFAKILALHTGTAGALMGFVLIYVLFLLSDECLALAFFPHKP